MVNRPILVGECGAHGAADPRLALFPLPRYTAGGRLCHRVMGLAPETYVRKFRRANLCGARWSDREARSAAERMIEQETTAHGTSILVLLGVKVATAFGIDAAPFRAIDGPSNLRFVVLPHPSGRCRIWNDPSSIRRARRIMKNEGVL